MPVAAAAAATTDFQPVGGAPPCNLKKKLINLQQPASCYSRLLLPLQLKTRG
jgi:hypothetical protein